MICAIDCDLRTSYCVTDDGQADRGPTPGEAITEIMAGGEVEIMLFEIASPVSFNRAPGSNAAMTQLAKWAIWNVAQAMLLDRVFIAEGGPRLLVAPSNVWTHGHDLKTRHLIAKCVQPKKDLREAEAMIWFYRQRPEDWLPLSDYLGAL